jgi:hypothetical protein
MKRSITLLLLAFWLSIAPAWAQVSSVGQASIKNTTSAMPAVDTAISFGTKVPKHFLLINHSTVGMYVDLAGNTATTADTYIAPSSALLIEGPAFERAVHIIGVSATGTYSVVAW